MLNTFLDLQSRQRYQAWSSSLVINYTVINLSSITFLIFSATDLLLITIFGMSPHFINKIFWSLNPKPVDYKKGVVYRCNLLLPRCFPPVFISENFQPSWGFQQFEVFSYLSWLSGPPGDSMLKIPHTYRKLPNADFGPRSSKLWSYSIPHLAKIEAHLGLLDGRAGHQI